jgi:nucleoside-diphosphate-sugar epimerase
MAHAKRQVFITGATGYMGRALSAALVARGHAVSGLCREASRQRLAAGVVPVIGDPLDAATYAPALRADHVVVHLVGTPKPAPWKAASFERVDLGSVAQLVQAVSAHRVARIVYVSVAQPAPTMRAYISARMRAETLLQGTAIPLTILRPWYVLGPGHWWPVVLVPFYRIAERVPSLRDGAQRLGLVTLSQMVLALVSAVEHADSASRVLEVPQIRAAAQ